MGTEAGMKPWLGPELAGAGEMGVGSSGPVGPCGALGKGLDTGWTRGLSLAALMAGEGACS